MKPMTKRQRRLYRRCRACGKRPGTRYFYPWPDAEEPWDGGMACEKCAPKIEQQLIEAGVYQTLDTTK